MWLLKWTCNCANGYCASNVQFMGPLPHFHTSKLLMEPLLATANTMFIFVTTKLPDGYLHSYGLFEKNHCQKYEIWIHGINKANQMDLKFLAQCWRKRRIIAFYISVMIGALLRTRVISDWTRTPTTRSKYVSKLRWTIAKKSPFFNPHIPNPALHRIHNPDRIHITPSPPSILEELPPENFYPSY